jgi:hypothetical protein
LRSGTTITGVDIDGIALQFTVAGAMLTSIPNLNTTDYVSTTPDFGFLVEPVVAANRTARRLRTLTHRQWCLLAAKHIGHHLRQFGV